MTTRVLCALSALLLAAPAWAATPCASLKSLTLPNVTITTAELVAAGPFVQPGRAGGPPPAAAPAGGRGGAPAVPPLMLPAHCRDRGDADALVRLRHQESKCGCPSEGWNGKYQAVGNGGWAGVISYPAMASALREGYATSSTDTGHVGGTSAPLIGHPEKVIDYSHRAVHEMTVTSKALINAFYDRAPRLSVLERLLHRRPPGADVGAALPGRLRRHPRRRARQLSLAPPQQRPGQRGAGAEHARRAAAAGQARDAEPGGAQRLRRDRRREGRPDHRAALVQVRPGDAGLQGRRCRQLPDAGAGRERQADVCAVEVQRRQDDLPGQGATAARRRGRPSSARRRSRSSWPPARSSWRIRTRTGTGRSSTSTAT